MIDPTKEYAGDQCHPMDRFVNWVGRLPGEWMGMLSGAVALLILGGSAYPVHPKENRAQSFGLTLFLGVFGIIVGWLIGLLASPYNDTEVKRFSAVAGALTALVTGFFLSKIDAALTHILSAEGFKQGGPLQLIRILAFVACVIVGGVAGYSFREYVRVRERAGAAANQSITAKDTATTLPPAATQRVNRTP